MLEMVENVGCLPNREEQNERVKSHDTNDGSPSIPTRIRHTSRTGASSIWRTNRDRTSDIHGKDGLYFGSPLCRLPRSFDQTQSSLGFLWAITPSQQSQNSTLDGGKPKIEEKMPYYCPWLAEHWCVTLFWSTMWFKLIIDYDRFPTGPSDARNNAAWI